MVHLGHGTKSAMADEAAEDGGTATVRAGLKQAKCEGRGRCRFLCVCCSDTSDWPMTPGKVVFHVVFATKDAAWGHLNGNGRGEKSMCALALWV